jgi:hypothetical protein
MCGGPWTAIPATQEVEVERSRSDAGLGKSIRPYLKTKPKSKRTGNVAQVVGYLA